MQKPVVIVKGIRICYPKICHLINIRIILSLKAIKKQYMQKEVSALPLSV